MLTIDTLKFPTEYDIMVCAYAARLSHKSNKQSDIYSDIQLLHTLVKNGDDHAKCVRGLDVTYLMCAPRYFWQEYVTYSIGNQQLGSESTMHSSPKFATEEEFLNWKQFLPEGTMQQRMFKTSYQTLRRMYKARRHHRLPEWKNDFCKWVECLPWAKDLIIF